MTRYQGWASWRTEDAERQEPEMKTRQEERKQHFANKRARAESGVRQFKALGLKAGSARAPKVCPVCEDAACETKSARCGRGS